MSVLQDHRRWINVSRVEQRVLDARSNSYKGVMPGEFIEGAQYEREMRGLSSFVETTKHLTQKVFYRLIQDEPDESVLRHMLQLEMATEKRETIKNFIEIRIKALRKQSASAA